MSETTKVVRYRSEKEGERKRIRGKGKRDLTLLGRLIVIFRF